MTWFTSFREDDFVETEIKTVDRLTKQYLILLACREIPGQDYNQIHSTVQQFQNVLIEKYGVTMGYHFCDPSIYKCWDNRLQEDIERYSGIELLIDVNDVPSDSKAVCNYQLNLNKDVGFLSLGRIGESRIEDVFQTKGIIKELSRELKSIKSKSC
jgi:hypothetical protein